MTFHVIIQLTAPNRFDLGPFKLDEIVYSHFNCISKILLMF